ncbi:MAG: LamG-like jellyroll fold domain-containing protein [Cytophagales bacterium]
MRVFIITGLYICLISSFFFQEIMAQSPGSGNALNFDGTDDRVVLADDALIDIQDEITIELWFKLNGESSVNDYPRVISKGQTTTSNGAYSIYVGDPTVSTHIGFRFISTTSTMFEAANSSLSDYDDGDWHHVAGVYSNSADVAYLYIDGVEEDMVTITGDVKIRITSDDLSIGGNSTRPFNGNIDEVRVWNDARTQTEIRDFMCTKLAGNESNLVAYWNFDDAATGSDNVPDLTSNNLDGTMTNMLAGDIETSAAPIGDASVYVYTVSTGTADQNIASAAGDDITIDFTAGTANAFYLYRVDMSPNVTTPPGTQNILSGYVYYGTKTLGNSGLTYTVIYNYDGHTGIVDENDLELAKRDDNADLTWSQESATLNTVANTLTLTGQTGSEYILASVGADALPIELLSFTAHQKEEAVIIEWKTISEKNNAYFDVLRSTNGIDWIEVVSVESKRDAISIIQGYTALDNSPEKGHSYYRLKQTDFDGTFSFSNIISLTFESSNSIQIYPNPSSGLTLINGNDFELEDFSVINSFGQSVDSYIKVEIQNSENATIDLSNLKAGLYFIKTATGLHKVFKQ